MAEQIETDERGRRNWSALSPLGFDFQPDPLARFLTTELPVRYRILEMLDAEDEDGPSAWRKVGALWITEDGSASGVVGRAEVAYLVAEWRAALERDWTPEAIYLSKVETLDDSQVYRLDAEREADSLATLRRIA